MSTPDEQPPRVGHAFMQSTKYAFLKAPDKARRGPQPPLELPPDPNLPQIPLMPPDTLTLEPLYLRALIEQRRSVRAYAETPLTLHELSYLLWCTQGVLFQEPRYTLRTAPGAGARHAFETYLLINRVEGLAPGLYRFLALEFTLQPVPATEPVAPAVAAACLGQSMLETCAVAFLWTAVAARMTWRYHQRGYRYLHLDAGHVCQKLYLAAESLQCGVCAIAAFDDDALNAVLGLDGDAQFAIYLATVGKKA